MNRKMILTVIKKPVPFVAFVWDGKEETLELLKKNLTDYDFDKVGIESNRLYAKYFGLFKDIYDLNISVGDVILKDMHTGMTQIVKKETFEQEYVKIKEPDETDKRMTNNDDIEKSDL